MNHAVSAVWLEALVAAAAIVLASGIAWVAFDATGAVMLAALGLAALCLFHFMHLARLLRWLKQEAGTPVPAAAGAWEKVFAALHRRTRQAAEQQQRLAGIVERFRAAFQAVPDGVVVLDAMHAIEWLNPTAEQHLGLSLRKDRGSPIINLVREPEFAAYLESGRYGEPLLLRPGRTPGRSLALQVIPYGEAQKLLLTRDISQLEKLEVLRRDFVANVSHELKTPLTVVSGFIETLLDGYAELSPAHVQHYLDLAREQAARMQSLVDDLLTLSALETGPMQPDERVSLAALLQEVVAEAQALSAGEHRISLLLPRQVDILGSRAELHSAIGNLVSNAVRYTPPGGRIDIEWEADDAAGGVLRVRDDGIGIAAQHLPRLTERFYRVDRGRSRESGGTGLGLAIVKHVLTRHQAQLEIQSEPGRGSCFSVRFPAQRIAA